MTCTEQLCVTTLMESPARCVVFGQASTSLPHELQALSGGAAMHEEGQESALKVISKTSLEDRRLE
jgi:hypothetical protein